MRRNHPSLKEVLKNRDFVEGDWVTFTIYRRTWATWCSHDDAFADGEIDIGYECSATSSYKTEFSERRIILNLNESTNTPAKDDDASYPFGSFSFYSEGEAIVTLRVSRAVASEIENSLSQRGVCIDVRINIPEWDDQDCKLLPITEYQLYVKND